MAEKETIMVLKVDLQCHRCYKKVKKVLSKLPQIRDQIYDEKNNKVIITVVCCSPEKIRDKICCKGGGSIKSIEIKPPTKPKEPEKKPEKPKEPEKKPEKPKEPEKKPDKPKEPEKKPDKPKEPEKKPKEPEKPKEPAKPKTPEPAAPPPLAYPPIRFCCTDCYYGHGHGGSPCYETYGRPVYESWGGGGGYRYSYVYGSRGDCFSEENPQGCSIM